MREEGAGHKSRVIGGHAARGAVAKKPERSILTMLATSVLTRNTCHPLNYMHGGAVCDDYSVLEPKGEGYVKITVGKRQQMFKFACR